MKTFYSLSILFLLCLSWMRVEAADHQARRIIVNDDGEVRLPLGGNEEDWDCYLAERLRHAVGTQVDSCFLNIAATDRGPGIIHSLQSTMAYWASQEDAPAEQRGGTSGRRTRQAWRSLHRFA